MILDEHVLRRVVGSHKIMAAQLRALIEAAERPNVRLWVLPSDLAGNAGLDSAFYLMDFSRGNSVVHMEHKSSGVFLEEQGAVDRCRSLASKLAAAGLNPAESVSLVATIAREHELK
jgi:hypothetical protein